MNLPISVITICYNNLEDLKRTSLSVDSQEIPPGEHLIIDGSTNIEILEWLTKSPQPPYRRWIHERDKGISDAFNKGILNSKGSIIHLLNSGDLYTDPLVIKIVMDLFENDDSLMWVHGKYVQHRGNIDVISGVPFAKELLWKGMRTVAHPTMFIRKEVYEKHGTYDTNLKIAMDYDMLVRIRNEKNAFISEPIVYFAPGGASNTHFKKGLAEVRKSHLTHMGKSFKQRLWQLRQRILHGFMQSGLGKKWFRLKNSRNKSLNRFNDVPKD